MNKALAEIIERIPEWPPEAQEEAVRALSEIEASGEGVYELSPEEEADIAVGLAQAERGEFLTDEEVRALYKRHGL
jgi:predicted transcriptional regulator